MTDANRPSHDVEAKFILRQARRSELERLMAFYGKHATPSLPAPSVRDLAGTLEAGRMLIIEEQTSGSLLASAAIFDFTPSGAKDYVGELSGTRVTGTLGGFGPISVQRLLIGAGLLGHAALEAENTEGCSSSLISIVRTENIRSIRNIQEAGFEPLENKPPWFAYEELAWHGSIVEDEWSYFVATDDTVRRAVTDLTGVGLLTKGTASLARQDRGSDRVRAVEIRSELTDLAMALDDLTAIVDGRTAGLSMPPTHL